MELGNHIIAFSARSMRGWRPQWGTGVYDCSDTGSSDWYLFQCSEPVNRFVSERLGSPYCPGVRPATQATTKKASGGRASSAPSLRGAIVSPMTPTKQDVRWQTVADGLGKHIRSNSTLAVSYELRWPPLPRTSDPRVGVQIPPGVPTIKTQLRSAIVKASHPQMGCLQSS